MKKALLSIVAFVMIIAGVNAQTSFGIKGGLSLANLGGDVEDSSMKIGVHLGAYANVDITDKFTLEPGLFFSTKGAKYESSGTLEFGTTVATYSSEEKAALTYLDLPVLGRINITSGFNIFAGPQFSYLLGAKSKYDYTISMNGESASESGESSSTAGLNKLDLGIVFGAGYQLESGLNFNVGYDLGLANINNTEGNEVGKVSNRVIKISVGYSF